ncbi:MAG: PAS domain S-box protein [Chitinophagaceae bacterium]|nr:PAS domain S-box protein [Chitinophagaceae bacterium]
MESVETHLRKKIAELTKQVEELSVIKKDYQEVIEHAVEMIFKLDINGNMFFTSAEFGRALGYYGDSLKGKHFSTIIHPEDLESCMESFKVLVQVGKAPHNLNFRVKHDNGSYRWVNCSVICLFDDAGLPTQCIGFAHEITDLVRSQELLAIENQRYIEATKAVAQAVVDAQEKERAEIGYELHDNVNQILSTCRLYLDLARNDEKERLILIQKSSEGIANAVSEIRKISRSLVPGSISDLGLIPSIHDLVESIKSTKALKVEFHHEGNTEQVMNDKHKLTLFRIIQEQVTNVLKHAEASLLIIELIVDKRFIDLSISDNGKGFDKDIIKAKKGVGLHNIMNRAELFNGTVNLVAAPGKGCKLKIHIPLEN